MPNTNSSILIIKSERTGQFLYFFGIQHSNDPTHSQVEAIKEFWQEFLRQSRQPSDKRIVLIERTPVDTLDSLGQAIIKYGESGEAQWLARQENINIECPEPSLETQRKVLCEKFDSPAVAYALIVRNLNAWIKRTTRSPFESALAQTISREAKAEDVYKFTPTLEWFRGYHKNLFGDQKLEDARFLASITDPRYSENSQTNKIIASITQIRNGYILNRIKDLWKLGFDVFIVYGRGHLDILRPDLEQLTII
ncbi:MAG: hypothetical protein A2941_00395 [Candidatus Yanofskybacteria bacterium RIFCSPLOWO2_01_FULL_49_17]|uniref:Uncharacterized protein n=1 Tax=Candidatus Yanofskybacteria bacterium RIFCSPLOWO2_01_FULL_49_17 TaxID=1802700 RepID=A0A1F8GPI3_9BACT|nr:MAG: hypothetical protein A2941_00395 [Candidatus Yanofskybacteria bacterium RIFCSPLOWO2_01_FULL_49_17]